MFDNLALAVALIFLALGAVILYDAVSTMDVSQTAKILGAAALLSAGLITVFRVIRNKVVWRRSLKN